MTNKHIRWFVYALLLTAGSACVFSDLADFDVLPVVVTMLLGYAIVTALIVLDMVFDVISRKSLGCGYTVQLQSMYRRKP